MATLVGFFLNFWVQAKLFSKWGLDGALYVLKVGFFFIIDGLLTAIYAIVSTLDLGSLVFNVAGLWAGLPPQVIYLVNAVGIPSGLSMILYAIVIRMLLNLIPAAFTRI